MTGKIFLSYRRDDAAWPALALFGRLEDSFPSERLFMDVEGGIGAGQDFVRVIEEQVSACDVMLVLIGSNWLAAIDEIGRRRLDNPKDFVRLEVESALRLGKYVVPVLVQEAEIPRDEALPETLKPLARRNAIRLTHQSFIADVEGLIKALESALAQAETARRQAATDAAAEQKAKADETDRQRFAIMPFLALTKASRLSNEQVATLIGVSTRNLDRITRGHHLALSRDQMDRLLAVSLVFDLLDSRSTADSWLRKPNPFLNDKSPIDWMMEGGIQRMIEGAPAPKPYVVLSETLEGLPIIRADFRRTVRLVSSARLRPSVLEALVSAEEAAALAEIERAASDRLLAQQRGTEGNDPGEFIHGVPYASFVNAAFAYWKPREANRFNAARGTWYAALDVETNMREVAHHMSEFLARSGQLKGVVEYAEMFANIAGEFVDLRQTPGHLCLNPDPAVGYPAGNALADAASARGLSGIVAPSVRHADGTQIVALRPHAVQSVAPGDVYRFEWAGGPEPTITRVSEDL